MGARQFHFVLVYDEADNKWDVDIDNEERAFPYGTIFDTYTDEWHNESELFVTNKKWWHDSDNLNGKVLEALKGVTLNGEDKN